MRNFYLSVLVIFISGCVAPSYDGDGGYAKLQQDRMDCLMLARGGQKASLRASGGEVVASSGASCSNDMFCLVWQPRAGDVIMKEQARLLLWE